MSEAVVVEQMLDIVSKYDRGDINLFEAVLRMQKAGSMMDEDEIMEALCSLQRQNVVQFLRKEE